MTAAQPDSEFQQPAQTAVHSDGLFGIDDLAALIELIPPKGSELLRKWMLRCVHQGVLKREEALRIRNDNPTRWDLPYRVEPNAKERDLSHAAALTCSHDACGMESFSTGKPCGKPAVAWWVNGEMPVCRYCSIHVTVNGGTFRELNENVKAEPLRTRDDE